MRNVIIIFAFITLLTSCGYLSAIKQGRDLSKRDKEKNIYTNNLHKSLELNYPTEFVENCLFEILSRNNIKFDFKLISYVDNDIILITLVDNDKNLYTYKTHCYRAITSGDILDSLIAERELKNSSKTFLDYSTITDEKGVILNIARSDKKSKNNNELLIKLDLLFKNKIEIPLLNHLNNNKNCSKFIINKEPNNICKLILNDTCLKKQLAIYTYKTYELKDSSIKFNRYPNSYPERIEKFYSNFTIIDSFNINEHRKVLKKLIYKSGEINFVY